MSLVELQALERQHLERAASEFSRNQISTFKSVGANTEEDPEEKFDLVEKLGTGFSPT